jgi:iron complex outermembrane recepter protein
MKILFVVLILSSFISAQDTIKHSLGEIEVTANKDYRLNSISISEADFRMQNSFTAFDALRFRTGIFASVSGKNEARLSIRGFDQRQISVMIDGAPVYIPYDGSFDLNTLQLAGFSRVSVSKSTPSILYGPNSMGGSINLITENPVKPFSARLLYQNGSSQNLNIGLNGIFSRFYWIASFGLSESDGFTLPKKFSSTANEDGSKRDNSSFNSKSGILKFGSYLSDNLNMALTLSHTDNSKDIPVNVYTARPRYWKYSEWNKSLANLMLTSSLSSYVTLKGNVFFEKFRNVLDSYDDNTYTTQTKKSSFHSTYDDHSYGLNLSSYISTEILPLTKIIFLYKRDTHKEQSNYNQPFRRYEAEMLTAGIEEEFYFTSKLISTAGISYDRMVPVFAENNSLRPSGSAINGNLGLRYNLSVNSNLYMNAARKSRFPTLKEFYSELLGSYLANPELSAEQNYSVETGAVSEFYEITIAAALFYNDVSNLIQVVSLPGNVRQYQNIDKAELKGIELEMGYMFPFVNTALSYNYLSARNTADNSYLPHRPAEVINLLLNKNYESGFEWNTETSFISKQHSFNSDTGELVRLSDYLLLNARIAYRVFSYASIYLRVNNITDKLYETEYGFPQPGREFFAGITAEL